jgi:hypothetical protein
MNSAQAWVSVGTTVLCLLLAAVAHAVRAPRFLLLDLFVPVSRPPHNNGVVITDCHQGFRVTRVKRHTVDDISVGKFMQADSIVTIPYVAVLVFSSAENYFKRKYMYATG